MFEAPIDYPCAVTDQSDDGHRAGITWTLARLQPGEKITMWVPLKSTLRANEFVQALHDDRRVMTVTGRGGGLHRVHGPILAMYAHADDIGRITQAQGITALCIVQWADGLLTWAHEVGAEVLHETVLPEGSPWHPQHEIVELDERIITALEGASLIMNHNNPITGRGFEKDIVVGALLELHDAGVSLPATAIAEWAAAHGWRGDNPKHLAEYCRQITRGSRPRVGR